mmetsp:Transcript_82266/g.256936  ORF Transcript_82266/g.256936 Transcript_82266/m.256936 type:complete len:212 (+) Transcript_82266:400-1035(+)
MPRDRKATMPPAIPGGPVPDVSSAVSRVTASVKGAFETLAMKACLTRDTKSCSFCLVTCAWSCLPSSTVDAWAMASSEPSGSDSWETLSGSASMLSLLAASMKCTRDTPIGRVTLWWRRYSRRCGKSSPLASRRMGSAPSDSSAICARTQSGWSESVGSRRTSKVLPSTLKVTVSVFEVPREAGALAAAIGRSPRDKGRGRGGFRFTLMAA